MKIRLATRPSAQALAQTQHIADRLTMATGSEVELVPIETLGDKDRTKQIWELGGQGVFVKQVQQAVLDGHADVAVHSAKDLPSSWSAEGLVLACVPMRGDARDALVGKTLADIPQGGVVASGSMRRRSMLASIRPDLKFIGLRGNIPTRVAKGEEEGVDSSVVAVAGTAWINLEHKLAQIFSTQEMIPQIGQGALAIECRTNDAGTIEALSALQDEASRRAVDSERAFLAHLGGGCEVPVGAYAQIQSDGSIEIEAFIGSEDGASIIRGTLQGEDAHVGTRLAEKLMASGGAKLLS